MSEKKDLETILQDAVDELFALQSQAKETHQKFLTEAATLIKAGYKQVDDSVQLAARAEKAARDSSEAAKQAHHVAHVAYDGLQFWQRATFWLAAGFLIVGIFLGLVYFKLGKEIEGRQRTVDILQMQYNALSIALKHKSGSRRTTQNEENSSSDESNAY